MATELTNEQIVTKLLSSNEIIKPKSDNFYISNPMLDTLGDFLLDIPVEVKTPIIESVEDIKYRFITI